MMESIDHNGVCNDGTKLDARSDRGYTTSVVIENDEICGIEVAPCVSDTIATISTEPMSSLSSDTISTRNGDCIMDKESTDLLPCGISVGSMRAGPALIESSLITSRVEDLFQVLDNEKQEGEDPILQLQVEYVDHNTEEEDQAPPKEKSPQSKIDLDVEALAKKTTFKLETEFFNLLEPSPNKFLSDLFVRSHQSLCQLIIGSVDVPFLFNRPTPLRRAHEDGKELQAPFMMFPNKNRALVSREKNEDYIVSSSGPISELTITQLFDMNCYNSGRNVKVKSIGYRQGLPSLTGTTPVHIESNKLQLRLNGWRRGRRGRVSFQSMKPKPEFDGEESKSGTEQKFLVPDTSLIPLVAGDSESDDVADLFADEELKAVLKITKDGDEASPLFPSFSNDDMCSDVCSNDGLDDEIGALDDINNEIRKELDFADVVIKGSGSADSLQRRLRKKVRDKVADLPSSTDTNTTLSITDSEGSHEETVTTDDSPEKRHKKPQRRVHFAERHEEFIYIADLPILISCEKSQAEHNKQSQAWFGKLEDAYMVLEDMMDDLALGCTTYLERSRKQPSYNKKIRASTAHYV